MIKRKNLSDLFVKPYAKYYKPRPCLIIYANRYNITGASCFKGFEIYNSSFKGAYFNTVDFTECSFYRCDFSDAEFRNVDFTNSIFSDCTFNGCSFTDCKFHSALVTNYTIFNICTFHNCNLDFVTISVASAISISGFILCSIKDIDADRIIGCTLDGCENIPYIPMACPDEGRFIGYKKALYADRMTNIACRICIVTLAIPSDAKRSSALGRKCRCNKAKIVGAEDFATGKPLSKSDIIASTYNENWTYRLGDEIVIDDFDENRWKECAPGFHFFMNKEEARRYL